MHIFTAVDHDFTN